MSYLKYPHAVALARHLPGDNPQPYSWASVKLACLPLVPITHAKRKRVTNMHVNFQAESVALPADAAGAVGRPDQAIISTQPIWPDRH
jgi:hypothetical protein